MLPGGHDQHVRRRGRPAADGAILARAGPRARPPPPHREGRAQLPAPAGHLGAERGQRADAPGRQRVPRLRRPRRSSPSSRRGGRLLFDASLPDGDGSYRVLPLPVARARPATRPVAVAQRTGPSAVTVLRELERGHGRRPLAGPRGPRRRLAEARRRRRRGAASRRASTCTSAARVSRCGRWARAGASWARRARGPPGRRVSVTRARGGACRPPTPWPAGSCPRAVVRAVAARPRRAGSAPRRAAPRCTARAASSCTSPSTTRAARWRSSTSPRALRRPRRAAPPAAGRPARHRRTTRRSSSSAPTRSPTRGAWPARRASCCRASEPLAPEATRVPRRWTAAAPAGPGARALLRGGAASACGCDRRPGRPAEYAALWRARARRRARAAARGPRRAAQRAADAPARPLRHARRRGCTGSGSSPTTASAQIAHRLDELGWTAAS